MIARLLALAACAAALYWLGMGGDCRDPKPIVWHWSGAGPVYQCR